jgi:hypothetical protein
MPTQLPSATPVSHQRKKHSLRLVGRTLALSTKSFLAACERSPCFEKSSLELRPDTLLKVVDIMVNPMVPPNGMATAIRPMSAALEFLNMPMPCSGAAINRRPMPTPTSAIMPYIVAVRSVCIAQANRPMLTISMVVPRKMGGNVILGQ